MAGFQQTIIIGNVGRDPDMRYTPQGVPVCDFSVAVTRKWKQGDEQREETTWFKVVCWRALAEIASQYVTKGRQVMLAGRVEADAYIAKDGEARAELVLTAQDMQLLGARGDTVEDDTGEDAPF